jgi:elongation factor G
MKQYEADKIHNVALVGHGHGGKTTLAEAMLVLSGAKDRTGRVEDGTATTDFDPDENKRQMSINAAMAPVEWKNSKINVIDAPGYLDFVGEVQGALRVVDTALIVVSANAGLEVGAEIAWDLAVEAGVSRCFFVSRMDRENANFNQVLEEIQGRYGKGAVPVQLPMGAEAAFKGTIDIIGQKAYIWNGKTNEEAPIPAEFEADVAAARDALKEAAAEGDDDLLMKYLEGEDLTDDEIVQGLREGMAAGKVYPVMCGASTSGIGINVLMDHLVSLAPSAADRAPEKGTNPDNGQEVERSTKDSAVSIIVWKTTADPYVGKLTYFKVVSGTVKSDSHIWNASKGQDERVGQLFYLRGKNQETTSEVPAGDIAAVAKLAATGTGDTLCDPVSKVVFPAVEFPEPVFELAVFANTKADQDKMGPALQRVAEEDPTVRVRRDPETAETLVAGMGESHVDIVVDKLKRKFGVNLTTKPARVPYRETFKTQARVQGKHKKQTGGHGQYGDCWVSFEPLPRGSGFEFVDKIVGGAIPRQFIPAVQKGIEDAMSDGLLAGYPVVDIRATVDDGSFHPVDSSEMAFRTAGSLAFRAAAEKCQPILLEPVLEVEVTVPEAQTGDIMSDLNTKRGRVLGMEPSGEGLQTIRAEVPQPEMTRYAVDLRSITRGRGRFKTKFARYEEVPAHLVPQIVADAKKEKEAAHG